MKVFSCILFNIVSRSSLYIYLGKNHFWIRFVMLMWKTLRKKLHNITPNRIMETAYLTILFLYQICRNCTLILILTLKSPS
jgi:hypothetical protein